MPLADPNKKFLYFNLDATSGEMDSSLCFPVSRLMGVNCSNSSSRFELYFEGSKGCSPTKIDLRQDVVDPEVIFIALVDEINNGEKGFITFFDEAEKSTFPSDIHFSYGGDPGVPDTLTLQGSTLTVSADASIGGSLTLGGHSVNDIDITSEWVDSDEHLMTSKAINARISNVAIISVTDSTANTDFPVVFHDESNNLHDDTAAFTYNPSTGNAVIPKIQTAGNIELGHASDTTVARLASGIVTVEGEEVVTTLTRSLSSGGVGVPLALMQVRRTLTEAEMNDLHNTPITIVGAQGADTVIVPTEAMMFIDRDSSTAQATSASLLFSWDGNSSYATDALLYWRRFMYNEGGDRIWNIKANYSGEVGTSLTAGTNKPVKAVLDLAITSGSIDSMDVYLTYYVLNIS